MHASLTSKSMTDRLACAGSGMVVMLRMKSPSSCRTLILESPATDHNSEWTKYFDM